VISNVVMGCAEHGVVVLWVPLRQFWGVGVAMRRGLTGSTRCRGVQIGEKKARRIGRANIDIAGQLVSRAHIHGLVCFECSEYKTSLRDDWV
jgi:hypothetical protein